MPIVNRMWSPDGADRDPDNRRASVTWQVAGVTSSTAARVAVDSTTSVTPARLNDAYVDRDGGVDQYMLCDGVSVATQGFELFTVTATFSVPEDGGSHNPLPDNPLDQPVEYSWEIGTTEEVVEVDINGEPIVNAAGDPPEQPCRRAVVSIFLNCLRNENDFNAGDAIAKTNKLNSGSFFGAAEGQAISRGIWSNKVTTPESVYWPVRYRFEFRDDGFKKKLINRGFNMIDNGVLKRIVDGDEAGDLVPDGVRDSKPSVSRPRLLKDDGGLLPIDDPPVVLEFDVYESINFDDFDLE